MDSTFNTEIGEEPYVSCIRVDGFPILPPVMTESKRAEMRYYRQLAIDKEIHQRNQNHLRYFKELELANSGLQLTPISTETSSSGSAFSNQSNATPSPSQVALSSRIVLPELTTAQVKSHQGENVQQDEVDVEHEDKSDDSDDSRSPSSTGTFIISRAPVDEEGVEIDDTLAEQELSDEDEDEENEPVYPEPRTVVRRLVFHTADLVSKRKRPTRYFDDETDEESEEVDTNKQIIKPNVTNSPSEDDNTLSLPTGGGGTCSTSLSKYIASTCSTPGFNFNMTPTPIPNFSLPNFVELDINSNRSPPRPRTSNQTPSKLTRPSTNMESSPTQLEPSNNSHNVNLCVPPSTIATSSPVLTDISNLRNYYIANETPKPPTRSGSGDVERSLKNRTDSDSMSRSAIFCESSFPRSPPYTADSRSSQEKMGNVGLSKFQNKMQQLNPALLKQQLDIRSPLLKGLVFPDPLERSYAIPKIPPEASDPLMKPKYDRVTAVAKGYLTRRLLHTEKIQIIIQTIRDTVELLLKLYEENPPNEQGLIEIKSEDQGLHTRLVQQLTGACSSFNHIFFKISVKERMAIIAHDREKVRAKALRNVRDSPSKRNISSATLKSIERRQTESRSPAKKDNQNRPNADRYRRATLKPISSGYGLALSGSQTVKPKGVKSYNVSPKRRRMSYIWGGGGSKHVRSSASARDGDQNDNNGMSRRPSTARPATSTRNSVRNQGTAATGDYGRGSETFIFPSSAPTYKAWTSSSRQSQAPVYKTSYSSNPNRPSMTRISASSDPTTGVTFTSVSNTRPTTLSNWNNRAPWKK